MHPSEFNQLFVTILLILGGGIILFLFRRDAKSEEDRLILRKQEIHRQTLSGQPIPEMISIASPIARAMIGKEMGVPSRGLPRR